MAAAARGARARRVLLALAALLAGALLAAGPVRAGGDEPAPLVAARPWSLAEVMARALDRHAGIAAAQAQAQASGGLADSQAVVAAPVVKLSADRDEPVAGNPARPARGKLAVAWSPPQPGEPALRRRQLQQAADQQARLAELVRHRVATEVRRLYATLALQDEMLRWSAQAQGLQARLVGTAEAQLALGRRSRPEWLALRAQALEAEAAHEALKAERAVSRSRLAALLGLPEEAPLWLARERTPFSVGGAATDGLDLQAEARARRPELQAAAARCAAVDADTRLKGLDNRRWLKGVELAWQPQQAGKAGNWEFTVEFTWPVTGDRNGDAASLDALRRACEAERDDLAAAIGQEVQVAAGQLAGATAVARQHLRLVATLQEAAGLADAARRLGRADEADLLGAQLAVARARVQALRKVLDVQLAELALRQAVGQALP